MSTQLNTVPAEKRIVQSNELVTGPSAREMLRQCLTPATSTTPLAILDNATGGGVLVAELLDLISKSSPPIDLQRTVAADIDDSMLAYARERLSNTDNGKAAKVELLKGDQHALPLPDESFDYIFNNFGIIFARDDGAALRDTLRLLKASSGTTGEKGGVAAFTSWQEISWMSSFGAPAMKKFIPDAPPLPDPITMFPAKQWNDSAVVRKKLEDAGFHDVQVHEFAYTPDIEPAAFAEACAYLTRKLAKMLWSKEEFERLGPEIEKAYLRYLEEEYPRGRWTGKMKVLVSVGRK